MNKADNETQQLHIYRALTAIFKEKVALKELLKFGVVEAILTGMTKFSKKSVQTSGLQLLQQIIALDEGLKLVKSANIKDKVNEATKEHASDAVVQHLVNEIVTKL